MKNISTAAYVDSLNKITETLSQYTIRLIQVESAICTFNLNEVQNKLNEILLFETQLKADLKVVKQTFEMTFRLECTPENFKKVAKKFTHLEEVHKNFENMNKAAQTQLEENRKLNDTAFETFKSIVPQGLSENSTPSANMRRRKYLKSKE